MVLIYLISQLFTYKLFPVLMCVLYQNGALSTDLISSDFISLQKSAQIITSYQNGFLIWIARLLAYCPPRDRTLLKNNWVGK